MRMTVIRSRYCTHSENVEILQSEEVDTRLEACWTSLCVQLSLRGSSGYWSRTLSQEEAEVVVVDQEVIALSAVLFFFLPPCTPPIRRPSAVHGCCLLYRLCAPTKSLCKESVGLTGIRVEYTVTWIRMIFQILALL